MLGSIAEGPTVIKNILHSDDTEATIAAFHALGIEIREEKEKITVFGKGLYGLSQPAGELFMRNSGTSMRILMGILAGQPFRSVLTADTGLSKRPLRRVTEPLSRMGAVIEGKDEANYPPIIIHGGGLRTIDYILPIASAQVKSAVLLAGLYAEGRTCISESMKSRDHTERMLKAFGADISVTGLKVCVKGKARLISQDIKVPGDISSAAFFMVGASIVEGSIVTLRSVSINPTRTGIIDILKMMGAKIKIEEVREDACEPVADITVESAPLRGITIEPDLIPRAIDELPVVMVAAALASGRTVIKGAGELKVKETDRMVSMATNLNRMGALCSIESDSIIIVGTKGLNGIAAESFGDHRTAMSMIVAGLAAKGKTNIDNTECISKSYPNFLSHLGCLTKFLTN